MADEPGQRHYLPRCEGTAIAEYQSWAFAHFEKSLAVHGPTVFLCPKHFAPFVMDTNL